MNKILVEVSVGELLDKISILEIKQEKIKDSEKLKFINEEHAILKDQLNNNIKYIAIVFFLIQGCKSEKNNFFPSNNNIKYDQKLNELFETLKKINAKLWIIEDDKRQCEKDKDFTEKFIKRN